MITTSPQELLSTIRSRAQIVNFNQLPDDILLPNLLAQGLSNDDATLLARLAHGSLGRATRWAQDIQTIATKNAAAAARQARAAQRAAEAGGADDDDDSPPPAFSPRGILDWTRKLTSALDGLVANTTSASQLAAVLLAISNEFAALQLIRDPLTSKDRAIRDAIGLLMGISSDYFADRLRQAVAAPHPLPLPSATGPLPPEIVHPLIAAARTAETQIDMNANVNLLLSATTTEWEKILHG